MHYVLQVFEIGNKIKIYNALQVSEIGNEIKFCNTLHTFITVTYSRFLTHQKVAFIFCNKF